MGNPTNETFDAVIVGSGFGGSVMAYRLAKAGLSVCVLERGKAWPPGSFPRSPHALKQALWAPERGLHGFFDLWEFKEIGALIASGLGGGSLIYANVFLRKDKHWFVDDGPDGPRKWPILYADLERHYKAVERMINPVKYPVRYRDSTPKTVAFREAAELEELNVYYPKLAITFSRGDDPEGIRIKEKEENIHKVPRYTCRLVGECDVGCNYGSKNSLDFNYLTAAWHLKAKIRCRHEVRSFSPPEKEGGLYRIEAMDYTDFEKRRKPELKVIYAKRLILSAGTLGTTYLLLANRSAFPKLSKTLGTRFSGNGDLITFASHCTRIAKNGEKVLHEIEPTKGPVITMTARIPDTADGGDGPGFYLQDAGYPAFTAWIQEGLDLPRFLWAEKWALAKAAWRVVTRNPQRHLGDELAGIAGERVLAAGTMPILGIGHEIPQGTMRLEDGLLDIDWSFDVAKPYMKRVRGTMRKVAERMGGEFKDNILRNLNQVITVHPLGGCPMGDDADKGVVCPRNGEVHGYHRLHVADGSVMPGSVGANPSLTIAAVADLFADGILEDEGLL